MVLGRRIAIAMLQYWVCVALMILIWGLLEGSFLYLQDALIWIVFLIGAGVYASLTWRDCRNDKIK
jgi:hypothetical protein